MVLIEMKLKKVKQSLEFSSKADTLEFFYSLDIYKNQNDEIKHLVFVLSSLTMICLLPESEIQISRQLVFP